MEKMFTKLQGQYLAFMATYTKLHRRAPAEADLQRYFGVTPPSVHNMVVTGRHFGATRVDCAHARSATDYRCACAAGSAASS